MSMNERSFIVIGGAMKQGDKREDIMQAALELVAEQGFHGAPMADIPDKAGVAAGTIYRYFENKDVLINELHGMLSERIKATLQREYGPEEPLRSRFLYIVKDMFRYFVDHPLHFRYMEQYYNSPYGISFRRDRAMGKVDEDDTVHDIIAEGMRERVMKDLPAGVLFALSFGSMIILLRDHILGFVNLDEEIITGIAESCWDAVKR